MRLGKKIVMVMKKTYNKPAINILQIIAPQMLMVSLDHDVEFNIWKQGDEGWADLD